MDKLIQKLQQSRKGGAILFCGAGLTADCLNFDEHSTAGDCSTVGVSIHLLKLLNEELKQNGKANGFRNIKNAAQQFRKDFGNHRLMTLLKDRFKLSNVSASIVDIARYPWAAIYTTNYDNGLEIALQNLGKLFVPVNNLDDPKLAIKGTNVIHLHGFAEAWDDRNFEQSCVLDASSYHNLPGVKNWLDKLRYDIERAEIVIFIGFSAADFHLSDIFFNSSGLQEKAFFINPPSSCPDIDERATQEAFGEPRYIGRDSFAQIIIKTISQKLPVEPRLSSFRKYVSSPASVSVPPVRDIEDLFVWGKVVPGHLKRDYELSKSDYHVLRNETKVIQDYFSAAGKIIFLHGDICDGKTLIVNGVMNGLYSARPIFELRHAYADLLDEIASILSSYPKFDFYCRKLL